MNFRNPTRLQKSAHVLTSPCYAKNLLIAVRATAKFFATQCEAITCTSISQFVGLLKFFCPNNLKGVRYSAQLIFVVAIYFGSNSAVYGKTAQRIIALSPHAVEMLYAIGAGDKIVGTVEHADYPEAALDILRIGN